MSLIDRLGTEKCDGCGKPFQAKDIVFDGQSFLCPDCLKMSAYFKGWSEKVRDEFDKQDNNSLNP